MAQANKPKKTTEVTKEQIAGVHSLIKKKNIQIVDLKFNDLPGLWQHFSLPASELNGSTDPKSGIWSEGIGFDGSSIRGFQKIQESDMVLYLDAATAVTDPVCEVPTLSIICNVFDPVTKEAYTRDPRFIAQKAEEYLKSTGIADQSFWGPEYEFFLFDDVRYSQTVNQGFYSVDSVEGIWNSGRDEQPNLGYKPRHKEGYFPVPPHDSLQDVRSQMILKMIETGIPIEVHHHEVATAGQNEIDIRYSPLVKMADHCMMYKYIVKNMARDFGMVATFMPKPLFGDNGSGMHTHQSLWKNGKNLFFDAKGYGMISETAKYYIGGLLKHANALMAFCAPSTNSYKRLVPGTRPRSTSCTRSGTVPLPSGSRCTRRIPKRSVLSSARPTRCATRTSPSLRSSWQASTVSKRRSTPASRSRAIPTSSKGRPPRNSQPSPVHLNRPLMRSKRITSSCLKVASSRRT